MAQALSFRKIGMFLVGILKPKESAAPAITQNSASPSKKANAKTRHKERANLQLKASKAAQRRKLARIARIRARRHAIHSRVPPRMAARIVVRKETMMPEPWSRVEKYKKIKKENEWGGYY